MAMVLGAALSADEQQALRWDRWLEWPCALSLSDLDVQLAFDVDILAGERMYGPAAKWGRVAGCVAQEK